MLTLGELRKGVEKLLDADKKHLLADWIENELPAYFEGRVLPVDSSVADLWGRLQATAGRPLPVIDSLLAATAHHHGLVLVTRNVNDFAGLNVKLINPWNLAD